MWHEAVSYTSESPWPLKVCVNIIFYFCLHNPITVFGSGMQRKYWSCDRGHI